MKRALRAGFIVLLIAGCERAGAPSAAVPVYQDKPLAQWLSQLEDGRGEARLQAIRAVGALGPAAKEAAPVLTDLLKDREARSAAALSLGSMGPEAKAAVPVLVRALRDEDQEFRASAAVALDKIGSAAVGELIAAVRSAPDRPPFYGENGNWFDELVRVEPDLMVGGLVAVSLAALVVFFASLKLWARHRERLAWIARQLDPDSAQAAVWKDPPDHSGGRTL